MASLILNGSTSGSITISSPAVSGSNTLSLPASTGTVLTTNGSGIASVNGVQFPATQSASADANCLDDYEEGTWTPSGWTGGGSSLTYLGAYVKVGRQVTVYFRIAGTGITSTAASSTLSGLPFVPSSTPSSDFYTGVCMNAQTNNGGIVQAYTDSQIYFAVSIASTTAITGTINYLV
jgi:hypothetical protein